MKRLFSARELWLALRHFMLWVALVVPVGVLAGSASALFLWSLDQVTELRWEQGWLLWCLPLGGVAMGWFYQRYGGDAGKGNNLIIEQIHTPGGGVPRRMAPLVLVFTLLTHLFGGSAGREGTAIQMGGSLASWVAKMFKLEGDTLRLLLMAGVAGGFGSVFGTPVAGAVFSMEVLVVGRLRYDYVLPVLLASVVGDQSCRLWGVGHAQYHISFEPALAAALFPGWVLLGKVLLAGILFGLAGRLFAGAVHGCQRLFTNWVPSPVWRPALGGLLVIALCLLLGTRDYLGIGVQTPDGHGVSLLNAFHEGGATPLSWFWKIVFTAVTLGAGFKGGEVTPLFFVGATLGNVLGLLLGAPVDLFAALGFVAVFAAASNTPLACTIMAVELFGGGPVMLYAAACFVAYVFSGHSGIYGSQRLGVPKHGGLGHRPGQRLNELGKHS